METSEQDLALGRALLTHLRAPESTKDVTFWAWERVQDMIDSGQTADAWRVIMCAIEEADTERDLALIGAGVLETLVASHADEVLPELLAGVKASRKLERAAQSMYLDDLPEEQMKAVLEAIGRPRVS